MVNIQIVAGREFSFMVSTIREILRHEHGIGAKSIITNGYVLNGAIRYLDDKIDFSDVSYWEHVSKIKIDNLLNYSILDEKDIAETMKFRLAALTNEKIDEISEKLSDSFAARVRKNYVVKLILKSYLYEKNK